jgi:hypothetical protein
MKIARHTLEAENLSDLFILIDSVINKTKLEFPKLTVVFDDHTTSVYKGFNPTYTHEEGWITNIILNQVNESLK